MMSQAFSQSIIDEHFPQSQFDLMVGNLSVRELVAMYGSPLYIYNAQTLRKQYQTVQHHLGKRVQILYALKANPNAAVAQTFRAMGAGAEVASAGEILIADLAGFSGASMHFSGPVKNSTDFITAQRHSLFNVNVDSEAELYALMKHCDRQKITMGISFRIQPPEGVGGSRMRMGGGQQKFGIAGNNALDLIKEANKCGWLQVQGLHTYAGTQCFDANAWTSHSAYLIDLANQLEAQSGATLDHINFGGGFGIGYYPNDPTFDIETAGSNLKTLIANDNRPSRRYYVELGRYLTAPAGIYVCEVQYIKSSEKAEHVILNGGMHHHAAAAGVGNVLKRSFPIVAAEKLRDPHSHDYICGGNLCTPADEFGKNLQLPSLKPGDLLAVLQSGAYGLTFSNTQFLSHPTPAEILVDGHQSWVVRQAEEPNQALHGQQLPA